MLRNNAFKPIILMLVLMAPALLAGMAAAEQANPFQAPLTNVVSYFTPLEAIVITVAGETITASLPESATLHTGMRMRVFRKGKPFIHPVTREVIVQSESEVGLAEVEDPESASLRLISGKAAPGDILRISSGSVRALFFQDSGVEWDVAEEYFYWLKDTDRFSIADAAPGESAPEHVAEIARDKGAEVAIALSMGGTPAQPALKQTLIWASDASVFYSEEFEIELAQVRTLRLGQEYFAPRFDKPIAELTIPFSSGLIAAGDIDGDGEDEIVVSAGSSLYFYKADTRLEPAFGSKEDVVLKTKTGTKYVWIEVADLDRDGDAEILVTGLRNNSLHSAIYDHSDSGFIRLWEGAGFIRSLDGVVYEQPWDNWGGFAGAPAPLEWRKGGKGTTMASPSASPFPSDGDIYNVAVLKPQGLQKHYAGFDMTGSLVLRNSEGMEIWKSERSWGGFTRQFKRTSIVATANEEMWAINDRLLSQGNTVLTFKRLGLLKGFKGLGHSETRLMGVYVDADGKAQQAELIKDMRGSALDFAISGNRLYLLTGSLKINPMNLFKGKQIFSSKLYIYKLMGE